MPQGFDGTGPSSNPYQTSGSSVNIGLGPTLAFLLNESRVPTTLATGGKATIASGGYAYVVQQTNPNFAIGTASFSLRARVKPANAASGASQALMGIWQQGTQANSQWMLYLTSNGALSIAWMDSSGLINVNSTSNPSFPSNNTPLWVRADVVATTGVVVFFTSPDGNTWTQLGNTLTASVSGSGVQSIAAVTATFVLGQSYGGPLPFVGDLYQAQLWIGGSLKANPIATASGFLDDAGFGWISGPSNITFQSSILGSNVKLKGSVLYNPNWPGWAEFWTKWDWAGLIKPMIQAAAVIGANCIKFNADGIADASGNATFSYPSDAVFQMRFHQLCSYAASLGLGVYLQIGYQPVQSFGADGKSVAAGTAAAVKIAGWADAEPNLLAIDVMNEWDISQPSTWGTSGSGLTQAIADLTSYVTAIRAVTRKPLTISSLNPTQWLPVAPIVDFHDVHYYYYNNSSNPATFDPTFVNAMKAAAAYKGVFLLGETGMPGDASGFTAAQKQAWMSAVPTVTGATDCVGGFHWTLVDTYGGGLLPGSWGMFPPGLSAPRPEMLAGFQTWPAKFY